MWCIKSANAHCSQTNVGRELEERNMVAKMIFELFPHFTHETILLKDNRRGSLYRKLQRKKK